MKRNLVGACRLYLLEGTQLAVDTAAGVLLLTPTNGHMHAMVVLGVNAALALAAGVGTEGDELAGLPWSPDIMQDSSVAPE